MTEDDAQEHHGGSPFPVDPEAANRTPPLPGGIFGKIRGEAEIAELLRQMNSERYYEGVTTSLEPYRSKPVGFVSDIVEEMAFPYSVRPRGTQADPAKVTYSLGEWQSPNPARDHAMIREALNLIEDVANIRFVQAAPGEAAQIRYVYREPPSGGAGEWDPNINALSIGLKALRFNAIVRNDAIDYGEANFKTVLHETMHAIGLDHPGPYNGGVPNYPARARFAQDTHQFSAMSYHDAAFSGSLTKVVAEVRQTADGGLTFYEHKFYPMTPQFLDIEALQRTYGHNAATRTEDTTYGFNSTAGRDVFDFAKNPFPVLTIWDAGGRDTLDLSLSTSDDLVDLRPGGFSNHAWMRGNIAIAAQTMIEDARGGSGNDVIVGWAPGGILFGGAGNDRITTGIYGGLAFGEAGDDILFEGGGDRDDVLSGGPGADTVHLGSGGDDRVVFYRGDALGVGAAADTVVGWGRGDSGRDRIDLRAIDADATTPEADEAFAEAAFGARPGALRYYGTGYSLADGQPVYQLVLEGDTDGDGAADFQILFRDARRLLDISGGDVLL